MNLKKLKCNITWQRGYAIAAWALFALCLLRVLLPLRATDLFTSYGYCVIFAMAAIYFYNKGFSGPIEVKLFLVYLAWILLTRYINRDFYLLADRDYVIISLLCFLFFVPGLLLEGRDRERLLDAISLVFISLFALGSLAGIFVAITNTYIHIPPENVWITIIRLSGLDRLNLFSYSALGTPVRLFMVWSLVVYQFAKRRNIVLKILLIIAALALHIAIAMSKARTTLVSMAVIFGMLAMLLVMHFYGKKLGKLQIMVLPVVAAAGLILCYKSFDFSNQIIGRLNATVAPHFEQFYESQESKLDPEYFGVVLSAEKESRASQKYTLQPLSAKATSTTMLSATDNKPTLNMTDSRDLLSNTKLSGRTEIWKCGLIVLKENPKIALFGCIERNMMDKVNEARAKYSVLEKGKQHIMMHNFLIQALLSLGIPGFLVLLHWTILMVKNMILMFFSRESKVGIEIKLLTLPLAGMFVINMAEVSIFGQLDLAGIVFFLVAGVFTSYYYESFGKT